MAAGSSHLVGGVSVFSSYMIVEPNLAREKSRLPNSKPSYSMELLISCKNVTDSIICDYPGGSWQSSQLP